MSSGFDRPNLTFDVVGLEGEGAVARKRATLLHVLNSPEGSPALPAIVYVGRARTPRQVAYADRGAGDPYRRLPRWPAPERRVLRQEAFYGRRAEVVVATNAFGMGVDKRTSGSSPIGRSHEPWRCYDEEAGRGDVTGCPRARCARGAHGPGRLIRFNTERETSVDEVGATPAAATRPGRP